MTTKTISTYIATGYTLAAQYDTLEITSTGKIGGTGVVLNHAASVTNYGVIAASGSHNGVSATGAARVFNTGTVSGYSGVFAQNASSVVYNFNSITGNGGFGDGVFLPAGGRVINGLGNRAFIGGQFCGVLVGGTAFVSNSGYITGHSDNGVELLQGGVVNNQNGADNFAFIIGAADGVRIDGVGGQINNNAYIDGAFAGVDLRDGGVVNNNGGIAGVGSTGTGLYATGSAATVVNNFEIQSLSGTAVDLRAGGTVTNGSIIQSAASYFGVIISGGVGVVTNNRQGAAGALIEGSVYLNGGGQVNNFGTVDGNGLTGVYVKSGTITNGAAGDTGAQINGYNVGVRTGPNTTVTNFGTIDGSGGYAPKAVELGPSCTLVVKAGCTFIGQVLGAKGTLDLAGSVAGGTGQLGLGAGGTVTAFGSAPTTFSNFGVVEIAAGATFSTNGAVTLSAGENLIVSGTLTIGAKTAAVTNDGLIETTGGTVTVAGKVSGAGSAVINGGRLDFASAFSEAVSFTATGTLELAMSQAYRGTITGFSGKGSDFLDLDDITFTGAGEASFSGSKKSGVLTLSDGTHTARMHFAGNYMSSTFLATSDGNGGVLINATPSHAMVPPPHTFINAMATLGARAGSGPLETAVPDRLTGALVRLCHPTAEV
jgi:hypothetical protein